MNMNNNNGKESQVTVFDILLKDEGKNGKTYWRNIGVAFPLSHGSGGMALRMHMFPNLSIYVKESIRPVGSAKVQQVSETQQSNDQDIPF